MRSRRHRTVRAIGAGASAALVAALRVTIGAPAAPVAADGNEALAEVQARRPDVVVLDWLMPGMDGIGVLERLRAAGDPTLVLMLTARDTVNDKIAGLDAGADDYLVKPFEIRELEARIRTLLRRQRGAVVAETLRVGDLLVDVSTLQVTRAGIDKLKDAGRDEAPFVLTVQRADGGEETVLARAVIDAPGTTSTPTQPRAAGPPAARSGLGLLVVPPASTTAPARTAPSPPAAPCTASTHSPPSRR